MAEEASLKLKTARTLKWNTVDRFGSQVLYAVVGVVLANRLSKEDFGLVGALLVFQAFGILFVDSGFGAALLQRRSRRSAIIRAFSGSTSRSRSPSMPSSSSAPR